MSKPTRPRHLFRARHRGDAHFLGRPPMPAVEAFLAAHRARLRPGPAAVIED